MNKWEEFLERYPEWKSVEVRYAGSGKNKFKYVSVPCEVCGVVRDVRTTNLAQDNYGDGKYRCKKCSCRDGRVSGSTSESARKGAETRLKDPCWREKNRKFLEAGVEAARAPEVRAKAKRTIIMRGKTYIYGFQSPSEGKIIEYLESRDDLGLDDLRHGTKFILGVKEADIVSERDRRMIEVDETRGHTEYMGIYKHTVSGTYIGYHHSKDKDAESMGYKVFHVCDEDYKECPEYWNEVIASWWRYGDYTVPSKFDRTLYY